MAIKKSELYSSLWSSCDELRGGMDASQYKDYVLVLLFIKYVSDKYAGQPYAPITIPKGASFKDMVALKGKPDIGDQINKKIIAPLASANKLSDFPDFNDAAKLGTGKEMEISQYRLAKGIAVPPRRINEIVQGKRAITADTALRLGKFFGMEAQFWMNLQSHYDLEVAKDAIAGKLDREVEVLKAA